MKRLHRYVLLWVLLLLAAGPLAAQNTVVYQCDFEQLAERNAWTRNKFYNPATAVNLYNKWYIGQPGNFGPKGNFGLYISAFNPQQPDSSKADYHAPGASYTVAYCDVPALTVGTSYTLQFDYRIQGDPTNAWMQVWWLPQSFTQLTCANGNFTNTRWVNNGGKQLGGTLSGKSSWDSFTATLTVNANQAAGRLVFLWSCQQSTPHQPSACVDNIVLAEGELCASAPSNIKYTNSTAALTWSGNSTTQYDVMFYNTTTETFEYSATVLGNKTSYVPLYEDVYTIYVRSHCENGLYSPWATETMFIWIAGKRCFDYMDLSNTKICRCYTGKADASNYNAYETPTAPIPWTYGSWESGRHTLHTDTLMTDPKTQGRLTVIPRDEDHETMSVRLGNAQTGSQAEGIVYTMHIPRGESRILKLKYALVQENGGHQEGGSEAGHHGSNEQSHFYVEIRDQYGHPQGEGCTTFNFSCPNDITKAPDESFHEAPGGIFWKDWTTVSISLIEYEGQTIQIRLGNYDCTAGGHFGYAYFTMGCIDGSLSSVTCSPDTVGVDYFEAPPGFNYRWYWEGEPEKTLSEKLDFYIGPTNDSVFRVECTNPLNGCSFTLVANPNPRYPHAGVEWSYVSRDCQNIVTFKDTSYVLYVSRINHDSVWISETDFVKVKYLFDDGTEHELEEGEKVFTHAFPGDGGIHPVTVVAAMVGSEGNICADTVIVVDLNLPDLHSEVPIKVVDMCDGTPYRLPSGEWVTKDTLYEWTELNQYGCDVQHLLDVRYHSTIRDTTYQAICEHTSFTFEGRTFSQEGLDSVMVATETGCDSVRYLNLHIIPDVRFALEPLNSLAPFCDDQPSFAIPVTVNTGKYAGAALVPDARAVAAGFKPRYEYPMEEPYSELAEPLDTVYEIPVDTFIRPGYYTFQLQSLYRECPVDAVPFNFTLYYSSKALYQKDGYIVLYNPEYNYADYEFSSYRWFRDGVLLPDTKSYIQPTDSDYQHIYQIELIPAGDSIGVMSCPLEYTGQFTPHRPIQNIRSSVSPSVVRTGEPLYVTGEGDARIYDALGRLVMTAPVDSENPVSILAPQRGGMYVVLIQNDAYRVLVH